MRHIRMGTVQDHLGSTRLRALVTDSLKTFDDTEALYDYLDENPNSFVRSFQVRDDGSVAAQLQEVKEHVPDEPTAILG